MRAARPVLLAVLLTIAALPVRAEDAGAARQREADALAASGHWDDAAAAYLEVAAARAEGWEAAARDAKACAARAALARGETAAAREAFEAVLREDPGHALALAGLSALRGEGGMEAPASAVPAAPVDIPAPPAAASETPETGPATASPDLNPAAGPDALFAEAEQLAEEGQLLAARERLRQVLRLDPGRDAALELSRRISRALVVQAEKAFHRHDRPAPQPAPAAERVFLARAEAARRLGHLPEETPLVTERPAPAAAPTPEERAREADLAHARAKALTLLKAEEFDLARAALEAIRAGHPEAADLIAGDLRDLEAAREAARRREEAAARARAESAARRSREERDAEAARRAAEADRPQPPPEPAPVPPAPEDPAGRDRALASAAAMIREARFDDAARVLAPLLAAGDPEAQSLNRKLLADEAAARRAREEAESKAVRDAAAEALAQARRGDVTGARIRLRELGTRYPDDPAVRDAFRELESLDPPPAPPPATPAAPGPGTGLDPEDGLLRRAAEAKALLAESVRAKARDARYDEACALEEGGFLEEARRRFADVAADKPGHRDVDRRLSRIDEAFRLRAALPEQGSAEARYAQAMALYHLNDLGTAETLLKPIAEAEGLSLWRRRRAMSTLADISKRRERARTLVETTPAP